MVWEGSSEDGTLEPRADEEQTKDSLTKALGRGLGGVSPTQSGVGEDDRTREQGEVRALGHKDAGCLGYWVQGGMNLWGPLGDPQHAYMSPVPSAGPPRQSGPPPAPLWLSFLLCQRAGQSLCKCSLPLCHSLRTAAFHPCLQADLEEPRCCRAGHGVPQPFLLGSAGNRARLMDR